MLRQKPPFKVHLSASTMCFKQSLKDLLVFMASWPEFSKNLLVISVFIAQVQLIILFDERVLDMRW